MAQAADRLAPLCGLPSTCKPHPCHPVQVASHAQKYFARLQGTTKRKSRFTQLEEKATTGFPSKASLQALPPLAQSSQHIATSAGGAPVIFV